MTSDWELQFADGPHAVLSVMPGESKKTFHDPLSDRLVAWEQDVFCPALAVANGELRGVYRAYGSDDEWRFGLARSKDGLQFTRSDEPVLCGQPADTFLGALREAKGQSVSFGDPRVLGSPQGGYWLFFNFFRYQNQMSQQQLAVATSRDLLTWTIRGRIFAKQTATDTEVIPERKPWRLCAATVVSQLEAGQFVPVKIQGRYWMYFSCFATTGPWGICLATSTNMLDWEVVRDAHGQALAPLPSRPGLFDSWYTDPVAAVLREDGVLLIYNGINADPAAGGDPRLAYYAHYPGQALFAKEDPTELLQRCSSPFKGGDPELEKQPIAFWNAPLYEAWCLVAFRNELLLYWNHAFGRRSVGLWKCPIPAGLQRR